ncbi:MAG: tetratricopeptide repeat protein [Magnetococcales bacterium]|nr:tetratricopeptide repeat protein [Magnetococcales bacterium]
MTTTPALQLVQQGDQLAAQDDPTAAEICYRRALATDELCTEAWQGLGLLHTAQRRYAAAIPCFEQAIILQLHDATAHHHLAQAFHKSGYEAQAIIQYEYALELQADASVQDHLLQALLTLGNRYHQQDLLAEAAACYQRLISLDPDHIEAHIQLGILAGAEGDWGRAQRHCQKANPLSDESVTDLLQRGVGHYHQGELLAAISCFIQMVAIQTDYPGHYNNLGLIIAQLGYHRQASRCYQQALTIQPDGNIYHNLAISYYQSGQVHQAEHCFRSAIALQPDYAQVYNNFGNFLQLQNRMPEALEAFAATLALDPHCRGADLWYHISQGSVWLAEGRVRDGWKEWVWAWYQPQCRAVMLNNDFIVNTEPWNGTDTIAGKQLLVIAGGAGFGDDILWCRYLERLVTTYQAVVTVLSPPALMTLLATIPSIRVVSHYPSGHFDAYIPLLALTYALDIPFPLLQPDPPYLTVPTQLKTEWHDRLQLYLDSPYQPCFTVGLCWMSGGAQTLWKPRSIVHVEKLWPLFAVPHTQFFSLQMGADASMLQRFPAGRLHDLSAVLGDFLNTAAIISQLDLLITVDSAYPHLAGAIGHPVWMLQADQNDARWMHDRDSSHWYPSMRLFRQQQAGNWDEVIEQAATALHQAVATKLSG